jgi:GTP1/Obg family GTP-binding protein
MLALMLPEPAPRKKEVRQVTPPPSDPAHALQGRFTCWEKRIENLMEFFVQVQRFQREQSRQYANISEIANRKFENEKFADDGIVSIWDGLRTKTAELAKFYHGLYDSYNDNILDDLKIHLADVKHFKSEVEGVRRRVTRAVARKHKRLRWAETGLKQSVAHVKPHSANDDPFVANRRIALY